MIKIGKRKISRFEIFLLVLVLIITSGLIIFGIKLKYSNNSSKNSFIIKMSPNYSMELPQIKLFLTGDVMLGRGVLIKSKELKDPVYPFRKVGDYLRDMDIVFINLENPVIKKCPLIEGGYKFCSDVDSIEGLLFSGVDVVNLANNHTTNFGLTGLDETTEILNDKGILYTGVGNLAVLERNNTKFGFLGFNLSDRQLELKDLNLIKDSDSKVDILVVAVHWGEEYKKEPSNTQKEWAKKIILSGADVISGHHPHWIQGSEYIEGKPVFYSLGNFIFDQMWSEETKKGIGVTLTYDNKRLIKENISNFYMNDFAQPSIVE